MNGFFRWDDPKVSEVAGYALPPDWWSRPYEYAWALGFAKPGQVVAVAPAARELGQLAAAEVHQEVLG